MCFLILLPSVLWARPKSVEFWFLKEPVVAQLLKHIEKIDHYKFGNKLAMNSHYECAPMGGGCFHPQLGFVDKAPMFEKMVINESTDDSKKGVEVKTFSNEENYEVTCDNNYLFDIFCGNAVKESKSKESNASVEIWVDISSSFKNVDYSKTADNCFRRKFIHKVLNECKREKVDVSIFNTSIKELGAMDTLCINHGTNNVPRLVDWVEASNAKRLIVITDVSEIGAELSEYLEEINAVSKGADTKDFLSKELMQEVKRVVSYCN